MLLRLRAPLLMLALLYALSGRRCLPVYGRPRASQPLAQVEFVLPNKRHKRRTKTKRMLCTRYKIHIHRLTHSPIHTHLLAQLYFDYARFGTPHSLDISTHNNATSSSSSSSWTRIHTHSCNTWPRFPCPSLWQQFQALSLQSPTQPA